MTELGVEHTSIKTIESAYKSLSIEERLVWSRTDPEGYSEARKQARKARLERGARLGRPYIPETATKTADQDLVESDFRTLAPAEKIVWLRTDRDTFVAAANAAGEARRLTQQFLDNRPQ